MDFFFGSSDQLQLEVWWPETFWPEIFWPEIFWLETFDKRSALAWRHEGRFFYLKLLIWDQHGNENSSESFFLMTAIPFRWRRLMALITFPKVRRKKNKINIMTGLAWYTDHVKGCHWFSTQSPIVDLPQMAIFTKYVFISSDPNFLMGHHKTQKYEWNLFFIDLNLFIDQILVYISYWIILFKGFFLVWNYCLPHIYNNQLSQEWT